VCPPEKCVQPKNESNGSYLYPDGSIFLPHKNQMAFAGITDVQAPHADDAGQRKGDAVGVLSWHGCMDLEVKNLNMYQTQCRWHAALDLNQPCATEDVGVFTRADGIGSRETAFYEYDFAGNRKGGVHSLEEKWTNLSREGERGKNTKWEKKWGKRCLAVVRRVGYDGTIAKNGVRKDDPLFLSEKPNHDYTRLHLRDQRRVSLFIIVGDYWSFADCACGYEFGSESTNYITGRVEYGEHLLDKIDCGENCVETMKNNKRGKAKKDQWEKDLGMHFIIKHRIGAEVKTTRLTSTQYETCDAREPMQCPLPYEGEDKEPRSGELGFLLPGEMADYQVLSGLTETSVPAESVDSYGNPRYFQWPPVKEELPGLLFRKTDGDKRRPPEGEGFLKGAREKDTEEDYYDFSDGSDGRLAWRKATGDSDDKALGKRQRLNSSKDV
jgi:hypothetical protein